ncbi:efflux RND transporter periplasmic adaptor subunit [Aeromicrobium sp.]|uniref:efflux RND transporter periplasmic adaptor subunit n=1 Tax=Aeromicrobium sp. TaxID=1871063 RepID=UPI002FC8DE14
MRRRILVAATTAAVIAVGGGVAYAQVQGSSGSYRTATVTVGDVDRTLALSGTIAASARQDLTFGVAGTVSKVAVEVGDVVKSGAVLAKLDDTDLDTAVTKAKADLAKARAQLESDQNSQSSTVADSVTGDSGAPSTPSTGGHSSGVSPELKAALAALKTQQEAVTAAQTEATTAIAAAKAALVAQSVACEVEDPEPPADDAEAEAGLSAECGAALEAVQSAQDVVANKQEALQAALETLANTLTSAVVEIQKSSSASPTSPNNSSGRSDGASSSPSPSGGGGGTVTAAMLAQDQAAIDTAKAALTEAERNRDAASLTAPFAGKILAVSAATGDNVASSDVVIVIVGDGDTTATTTVTADQVDDVKVGQTASVTPAGAAKAVTGTVTSIGLLPDSDSDSTAYPVTLVLNGTVAAPEGSTASIALVIGTAKDALTVPSSAVSTTGRMTVSVLTDGKEVRTPVTVGVVGPTRTSITQGLKKGQEVVIANLTTELPSGDDASTRIPGGGGFSGIPSGMRQQRRTG